MSEVAYQGDMQQDLTSLISPAQARSRAANDLLHLYRHGDPSTGTCGFHAFVRDAWRQVESDDFSDNWHIESICRHLMAMTRGSVFAPEAPRFSRLIIAMPPRHMKSLLANVFFPAWVWMVIDPGATFFHLSFALKLSERDSRKFAQLIKSDWYLSLSNYGGLKKDTEDRIENRKGGHRIISSMESATGDGGQYVIIDDPISAKLVHSKAERRKMIQSWKSLATRRNNKYSVFVVIGQRTHEEDLNGYLLKHHAKRWQVLMLEAVRERDGTTTRLYKDPRKLGEYLWPEQHPPHIIEEIREELGPTEAAAQLQQRPVPAEGAIVKHDWWRYFKLSDMKRIGLDVAILSWDTAVKDGEENSWVVGMVVGKRGSDVYLFDVVRGHWDVLETANQLELQAGRWKGATIKVIEDKANGAAVMRILRDRLPGMVGVNPQGSKEMRLRAYAAHIRQGRVYIMTKENGDLFPWAQDFFTELETFPRSADDDQVDALTQALAYLYENYEVGEFN